MAWSRWISPISRPNGASPISTRPLCRLACFGMTDWWRTRRSSKVEPRPLSTGASRGGDRQRIDAMDVEVARREGRTRVGQTISDKRDRRGALFKANGYEYGHHLLDPPRRA